MAYSVEVATSVSGIAMLVASVALLANGNPELAFGAVAIGIMALGFSLLWIFACIGATKASIALTRAIILSIKKKFVKRG